MDVLREDGDGKTSGQARRIAEAVLSAFDTACDGGNTDVAALLLYVLETLTPDSTDQAAEILVGCHFRLLDLKQLARSARGSFGVATTPCPGLALPADYLENCMSHAGTAQN